MIERLEGDLIEVGPDHLLINVGGVGVRALVSKGIADRLSVGRRVAILTRLVIRDGDPQLFGFLGADERASFDALLSVSGVGPRIALAVLSSMEPERLAIEIEKGSSSLLMTVPGVGKKLAARILLELKGRISLAEGGPARGMETDLASGVALEAVRALTALGYPQADSREAVRIVLRDRSDPLPLDQLLREALVGLSRSH